MPADLASALHARLKAHTPVAQAIGTRIYPRYRPQGSPLPAIRFSILSDVPYQHLKGVSQSARARVQFDVFAKSYIETRAVARLVSEAMHGPMAIAGVQFGGMRIGGIRDGSIRDEDDANSPPDFVHMASVDLLVTYSAT